MATSLAPGLSSPGQAAIASPSWHQCFAPCAQHGRARGQVDSTQNILFGITSEGGSRVKLCHDLRVISAIADVMPSMSGIRNTAYTNELVAFSGKQEGRTGVRSDEERQTEVDRLVAELIAIGQTEGFLSMQAGGNFNEERQHIRAREIGTRLNDIGGKAQMQRAYYIVRATLGITPAMHLEVAWKYIGGWMP